METRTIDSAPWCSVFAAPGVGRSMKNFTSNLILEGNDFLQQSTNQYPTG